MPIEMAFLYSTPSFLQGRRASPTRTCICMKARKGSSGPQKKSKKSERPVARGVGFGSSASSKSGGKSNQSDSVLNVVKETTSGAEGDATPHRAAVLNVQTLEDPRKTIPSESSKEIEKFVLSTEVAKSLRFKWGLSLDETIEQFEDARQVDNLHDIVIANRHLVSAALLYRFTSAILRIEGDSSREQREEESRNMRDLRKRLIAICWEVDLPFKRAVMKAEERLMNVLQSNDVRRNTERMAGRTRSDIDAFWVVIYAAISAWEERGRENAALSNINVQESLSLAASTCRTKAEISNLLSPSLKIVENVLNLSNPSEQEGVLESVEEEDVIIMATLVEQVRQLPTNAYSGIRRRMQKILDFILSKKYGVEPAGLRPIRFQPPEIERGSAIASFKQTDGSQQ